MDTILKIKRFSDGQIFDVFKYINSSGQISIWCNEWYGRHVVGQDCELIYPTSKDSNQQRGINVPLSS